MQIMKAALASIPLLDTFKDLDDDDDDDVYLRLQHGRGFHNLVCISYVKHINPAFKA
jgi:hypothetical protein